MNKPLTIILAGIIVFALGAVYVLTQLPSGKLSGVYTNITPTNSSTSVLTSATVVFATATGQTCRKIWNDSATIVYCALSNTVSSTVGAGIRLTPPSTASSGPTMVTFGCGDTEFRAERITCIASGTSTVDTLQY